MNRRNHSQRPYKFFFPLIAVAFVFVAGAVVMFLWNRILPDLFGTKSISYWQAVGLLILCKILFGFGFGRCDAGFRPKRDWKERIKNMSDEDKERFREEWRRRFQK